MPGIHVLKHCGSKGGDHRDKPGHDEDVTQFNLATLSYMGRHSRMPSAAVEISPSPPTGVWSRSVR